MVYITTPSACPTAFEARGMQIGPWPDACPTAFEARGVQIGPWPDA